MDTLSSETNRFNPRGTESGRSGRNFGMRYPSPFFDVASQYQPENMIQLLGWCRYYFLNNPIINVAVSKLAEYPVTDLVYEHHDPEIRNRYSKLESVLRLRSFQIGVGLDFFAYGNAFVSVATPFCRWLQCKNCGHRHMAKESRSRYVWKDQRFVLTCAKCSHEGAAAVVDTAVRSFQEIRLIRWNPENITIKHNEATGKDRYYYKIPKAMSNDILIGDPDTIETTPLEFLEAVRQNRQLLFSPSGMYHLKREGLAQADQGWGTPIIYPLLKDAFLLQVMKKAQESLLMEHIVPMRVIFPNNQGMPDGIFDNLNLSAWKASTEKELSIWKRDPNYIPILPIPLGFQQFGADGKSLILHQEFRLYSEQMLVGAGIPIEFVYGGLQWQGTNTSLRALENMFYGYNKQREELVVDFILGRIADFMEWPRIKARFGRFKMADDLQRAMFYFQLNQASKISDRRLHEELGTDFEVEADRIKNEVRTQVASQRRSQVAAADVQGEASLHTSRYQAKAMEIQQAAQMKMQMKMQAQMPQGDPSAQGAPPEQGPPPEQAPPPPPPPMEGPLPAEMGTGQSADDSATSEPAGSSALGALGSPLQPHSGGMDLGMVARKVASYLRQVGANQGNQAMYSEIERLQLSDPNLYRMVFPLLNLAGGSKVDPLNPQQSPAPNGTPQKDISRAVG
jgi:hypothetical protein